MNTNICKWRVIFLLAGNNYCKTLRVCFVSVINETYSMDVPRAARGDKSRTSSWRINTLNFRLQPGLDKLLLGCQGLSPEITPLGGPSRWFCHHISLILSNVSGPLSVMGWEDGNRAKSLPSNQITPATQDCSTTSGPDNTQELIHMQM